MAEKEFLRRIFKTMNRKFIGFDIRILPLLGTISLIIPIIFFWQHRWADALGFGVLLLLCILFSLSVYDVWKELLPLEQAAEIQRKNPNQFMSARLDAMIVSQNKEWVSTDVVLASRLPFSIAVKSAYLILWLPTNEGKHRYDLKSHMGQQIGLVSGEANQRDLAIRVHVKNAELLDRLLKFVGDKDCDWLPLVEGQFIITIDQGKEIKLDIPETTIPIWSGSSS